MTYALTWLADVLRAAGLKVVEQPGWKERGRREMGKPKGVLVHHTASAIGSGNAPCIGIVTNGRPDLPGPLAHTVLGRDGTWYIIAAGRCNHAGAGSWHGVTDGNGELIGVEAENAGTGKEPWPAEQMNSYVVGTDAILDYIGADPVMAAGHKEYALPRGRKIDPTFDMVDFRHKLELHTAGDIIASMAATVSPTDPARAMLRKGDQGESVRLLQEKLGITGLAQDGKFGPATDAIVRNFQAAHGLVSDGLVGPKTWDALGVANNG